MKKTKTPFKTPFIMELIFAFFPYLFCEDPWGPDLDGGKIDEEYYSTWPGVVFPILIVGLICTFCILGYCALLFKWPL